MVGCSIRNCKSVSVKGGEIMFFTFPREESVAKEWLRYCGSKTTIKNGRVCSKHFLPSDYHKSLRQVLLNYTPKTARKLKPDAVPTLHIDDIHKKPVIKEEVIEAPSSSTANKVKDNSENLSCLYQCNTLSANEAAGSSMDEEKSVNGEITISLDEYKSLKKTADKFQILKQNLDKIFTTGQVRCLMSEDMSHVQWSADDIVAAISLRSISPKGYLHLRSTGVPLPALSTLRSWTSKIEIKEVTFENEDSDS